MNTGFSYDALPYPSYTFPQTRPDRLATMGTFYGIRPANPAKCRMLELGCGDGANLLSFAYVHPESEFVGVDLSAGHIADANAAAKRLALPNVAFIHDDVMNIDSERIGTFDFIVAHGLFSWVPDFVRTKILEIYEECLEPQGVGYISYNAYPGCHIRQIAWEMMQFHASEVLDPMEKVSQGINGLGFLSEAAEPDSLYQMMLRFEVDEMSKRTLANVFHDELSEFNQPFYFREFIRRINAHGLQFLSEADLSSTYAGKLAPEIRKTLDLFGPDIIRREQYMDFIKCSRFRSTLICRSEVKLNRDPAPDILKKFRVASQVSPDSGSPNITDPVAEKFAGTKGASLEINHPLTKAALVYLKSVWSRSVPFVELIKEAGKMIGVSEADLNAEKEKTSTYLIQMFQAGFVKLHLFQPEFAFEAGEFPLASAFAREQIERGCREVTTLTGMNLKPEDGLVRLLLALLDGTRDRAALTAEVLKMIEIPAIEKEAFESELPNMIEFNLTKFAEAGLLMSQDRFSI